MGNARIFRDDRGIFQCDVNTKYDVVQFLPVLDNETNQRLTDHGPIITTIRYRTPYLINKRDPLLMYFALGKDDFLHRVLDFLLC